MNKLFRTFVVALTAVFAAGCANQDIKPVDVICPVLGGVAGTETATA